LRTGKQQSDHHRCHRLEVASLSELTGIERLGAEIADQRGDDCFGSGVAGIGTTSGASPYRARSR